MEVIPGTHTTSKVAAEDVFSNMPDIVITNILDRLPLNSAMRTSVLSRKWRFKWTMISQLVFDERFFMCLSQPKCKINNVRIVSRVLLHLRDAITKFVIFISEEVMLDAEDINNWISFLSRKGIEDITIKNECRRTLKLSAHLYSCLDLKHLTLYNCSFHPPPSFRGFPKLLSLKLCSPSFGSRKPREFFTRCPSLESLYLSDIYSTGKERLFEVAELENLKILSLPLSVLDPVEFTNSSNIIELLGSLPKLQELNLDFDNSEVMKDGAKKTPPAFFSCLKELKLSNINLDSDLEISCALELIRSLPNIQSLEITTKNWGNDSTPNRCFSEMDYNTLDLLQLRNVFFTTSCDASENDLMMMKYLLACSPFLKKFIVGFDEDLENPDEKIVLARKVLKLQRAYHAVDMDLSV